MINKGQKKIKEIFEIISQNTSVDVKPMKTISKNITLLKKLIIKLIESLIRLSA